MKLYSWIAADDLYQFNHNGTATFNGGTVWTSANDGSGSGLDADKLDGQEGSHYLNYNNLTNKPSIVSPTGSGASGTWGINITGSANSANTATDADKLDGLHTDAIVKQNESATLMSLVLLELVKILEMEIIVMLSTSSWCLVKSFPRFSYFISYWY